jgi:two-component system, NarL family, response regulator
MTKQGQGRTKDGILRPLFERNFDRRASKSQLELDFFLAYSFLPYCHAGKDRHSRQVTCALRLKTSVEAQGGSTMSETIGVLLVDDHPIVREGLAAIIELRQDIAVVGEAGNGADAMALYRQKRPDVTLMDLQLPDKDGAEVIAALKKEFPASRFIVLTTYDEDEAIYRAVRAGARGFLLKDTPHGQILDAIRTVYAGGTYLPSNVAAVLTDRMSRPEITEREMEVLRLMASGLSNLEIGEKLFIAEATVKSHVNNLLRKMHVTDRTQAVIAGLERGLITLRHKRDHEDQA